jgi:hypothetical protein
MFRCCHIRLCCGETLTDSCLDINGGHNPVVVWRAAVLLFLGSAEGPLRVFVVIRKTAAAAFGLER